VGTWEDAARPFLETYVSRRRGETAAGTRLTMSEADVSGLLADLHRRGFGGLTAETVRPRLERLASAPEDAPSYWDSLRRHAPAAVRAMPKAATTAVKRFPWARSIVGAVLAAIVVIGVRSWFTPEAKVALSPHAKESVPSEIDLMDLEPFSEGCDPDAYDTHLDRILSGRAAAGDVACVAALSDRQTVDEVLEAPLTDTDALVAHRRRRNVFSALAAAAPEAVGALCARLGDPDPLVRIVVGTALAGRDDDAAMDCVRDTLSAGSGVALDAAVVPLRHHLARDLIGVDEGWSIVQALLADPDPDARIAGLKAAPMYTGRVSEPLVSPMLEDPDPAVAAAAKTALGSINAILRTDLLRGNVEAP
jgi:HEAT repeat protein